MRVSHTAMDRRIGLFSGALALTALENPAWWAPGAAKRPGSLMFGGGGALHLSLTILPPLIVPHPSRWSRESEIDLAGSGSGDILIWVTWVQIQFDDSTTNISRSALQPCRRITEQSSEGWG